MSVCPTARTGPPTLGDLAEDLMKKFNDLSELHQRQSSSLKSVFRALAEYEANRTSRKKGYPWPESADPAVVTFVENVLKPLDNYAHGPLAFEGQVCMRKKSARPPTKAAAKSSLKSALGLIELSVRGNGDQPGKL